MQSPEDVVGLRERLRLVLAGVSASPQIDGIGCLLLDGEGALRYVTASDVAARGLEAAEELCVEGPCHETFAQGSTVFEDVVKEARWQRLTTLLAMTPIRSVLGEPVPVFGASLGAVDAFSAVPQQWSSATVQTVRDHAARIGELIEQALTDGLDEVGDELTVQLRAALASREVLHTAMQVVRSNGGDQHGAMLRMLQLGRSSGVAPVELARQVIELGRMPDAHLLEQQASAANERSAAVEQMAWTDPLTGLVNRARFFDRLEQALRRTDRLASPPAVVFLDLDDFKWVNDTFGHDVGDHVLREAARRLLATVRGHDTVCRLGGDEFTVLCEGTDEPGAALKLATRLADALRAPFELHTPDDGQHPPTISMRVSIGVAVASRNQLPAELLRQADLAMYASKRQGDGDVQVFDEHLGSENQRRKAVETALRAALAAPADQDLHGIRLDYQPIVDLTTRRAVSVEALVRWTHPQLGQISATELIDVAESTGLIVALGARLLQDGCRAAARWQRHPDGADVNVAVNVSAIQLADDDFAATVEHALAVSGLPADQLCLELTETRLLTAGPGAIDMIERVGALGVNLTLDDFGTGYSSMSHLADLPVQVLKVDRAFVIALDTDDTSRAAVARASIGLATALELDTVAEGVETAEQADTLHALGGRLAQGYYFSRPVRETDLRPLLSEQLPA